MTPSETTTETTETTTSTPTTTSTTTSSSTASPGATGAPSAGSDRAMIRDFTAARVAEETVSLLTDPAGKIASIRWGRTGLVVH